MSNHKNEAPKRTRLEPALDVLMRSKEMMNDNDQKNGFNSALHIVYNACIRVQNPYSGRKSYRERGADFC